MEGEAPQGVSRRVGGLSALSLTCTGDAHRSPCGRLAADLVHPPKGPHSGRLWYAPQ
jgi:hypothetical protein